MPAALAVSQPKALPAITRAGLLAGVLDITAAFVVYSFFGAKPLRILKGIAAGILGKPAMKGGLEIAALGLLCHFAVAFGAATGYYLLSRKIGALTRHPWIVGPFYGIFVYFFMQLVVLPLSAIGFKPGNFEFLSLITGLPIHIVCVGLPIATMIARYAPAHEG